MHVNSIQELEPYMPIKRGGLKVFLLFALFFWIAWSVGNISAILAESRLVNVAVFGFYTFGLFAGLVVVSSLIPALRPDFLKASIPMAALRICKQYWLRNVEGYQGVMWQREEEHIIIPLSREKYPLEWVIGNGYDRDRDGVILVFSLGGWFHRAASHRNNAGERHGVVVLGSTGGYTSVLEKSRLRLRRGGLNLQPDFVLTASDGKDRVTYNPEMFLHLLNAFLRADSWRSTWTLYGFQNWVLRFAADAVRKADALDLQYEAAADKLDAATQLLITTLRALGDTSLIGRSREAARIRREGVQELLRLLSEDDPLRGEFAADRPASGRRRVRGARKATA